MVLEKKLKDETKTKQEKNNWKFVDELESVRENGLHIWLLTAQASLLNINVATGAVMPGRNYAFHQLFDWDTIV